MRAMHLPRVERDPQVGRDDAEQLLGVEQRLGGRRAGRRAALAPVQPRDDPPAEPDRVELVDGQVVGQPGHAGVHLGAAERLVVGLLAGRHLHQRRPAEEHLGLLARPSRRGRDMPGHVRAAGGGVAEHQRDRRDAGRATAG